MGASPIFSRRRGFTLIELMMVIGILVLLTAILLPMIARSYRAAGRFRTKADLGTIGIALEEFKKDTGDYPRLPGINTGFALLGRDLIGPFGDGVLPSPPNPVNTPDPNDPPVYSSTTEYKPGDCVQQSAGGPEFVALVENLNVPTTDVTKWAAFNCLDGADGPGRKPTAKKFPSYLQSEKFRLRGVALLDNNDKPILYFPGKPAKNLTAMLSTFVGPVPPYISSTDYSVYNANANLEFFKRFNDPAADVVSPRGRMAALLGDLNNNGLIDPGESAVYTGPYLLWAAGPDGLYGPNVTPADLTDAAKLKRAIEKCDDVTNFRP